MYRKDTLLYTKQNEKVSLLYISRQIKIMEKGEEKKTAFAEMRVRVFICIRKGLPSFEEIVIQRDLIKFK